MAKVHVTELVLRDGHQSLIATRLRTDDMLPICSKLDSIGFWSLEAWGGATFDACVRFLKEDPWERLRALRAAMPNLLLQMLLRAADPEKYRERASVDVSHGGVVGVLWMGARDVRDGTLTPGELVQFVIYAVLVAGAAGSLSEIWGELQRAAGATERLVEMLDASDPVSDPSAPVALPRPVRGEITLDNVTFFYPARPEFAALNGVSLTVAPGETVALVGPSGAGKSSILQLLMRFYDPQGGAILLDGHDLRSLARTDFRAAMALVPQDPVIFAASALENIRFGRPDASEAEVIAAAEAASAHGFITALPQGYATYLGERGVMLSGGQKQRIAIARAILERPDLLLFDDATRPRVLSSLDALACAISASMMVSLLVLAVVVYDSTASTATDWLRPMPKSTEIVRPAGTGSAMADGM